MAAKVKTNEYMSVDFRQSEKNSGDTIRSVSMNWENRTDDEIKDNLNAWLVSCNIGLEVVVKML